MASKNLPRRLRSTFSRILKYPPLLFHPHWNSPRGVQHEPYGVSSCDIFEVGRLQSLQQELDLSLMNDLTTSPERLVHAVQSLKPFLPTGCELLGQGDLNIMGSRPVDAGGFADVWVGERNGVTVAIKSYRYYASSGRLHIYLRLYQEALMCNYLNDGGEGFVPFIGVYSTLEHPFALVFKFADRLNLREYIRKNRDSEGLKLLTEIAGGLRHVHSLGIVHGNLNVTNVLVGDDGRALIGGLGMAFMPSAVQTRDRDRSFWGAPAPELIEPWRWGLPDARPTPASDVFAFAAVALEVLDDEPPFSHGTVVAGMHSMLNGIKPKRADHPKLSNRMWKMIRRCLRSNPAECMTLAEVIAALEAEGVHKSK